jgi:hypothetical protein
MNKIVDGLNKFNMKDINCDFIIYDPDSSPEAWEYYMKYYPYSWTGKDKLEIYEFDKFKLRFYKAYRWKYYDSPEPEKNSNRLFLLESKCELKYTSNGIAYYDACRRLGGDTDFNFKGSEKLRMSRGNKYKKFYEKLEDGKYLDKLNKCRESHHMLLNFSVMEAMGNLQGIKNYGLKKEETESDYECLDRLDTLVYLLSNYYDTDQTKNDFLGIFGEYYKKKKANIDNQMALKAYLDSFDNTKDYCKKVYFISDDELVKELIENGKKLIIDSEDVIRYIDLANKFWAEKEVGLKKIDAMIAIKE